MEAILSVPQAVTRQAAVDPESLALLSDRDLLVQVARLAGREREATADLVHALCEIDARKLYLQEGCASLFTYCTERLHLSEHAAYRRIEAARLARRLPLVLERLRDGAVTLTAASLLGAHLTDANCREVLDAARYKSKRAVEEMVARLRPQPDVPTSLRRLPPPRTAVAPASVGLAAGHETIVAGRDSASGPLLDSRGLIAGEASSTDRHGAVGAGALRSTRPADCVTAGGRARAEIRPLSPARYSLHLTISAETHRKLRRAQQLLRPVVPTGDPAEIIDRALTLLVGQLERRKHAELCPKHTRRAGTSDTGVATQPEARGERAAIERPQDADSPRASHREGRPRYIPAAVRRAVWRRDEGQCTFVGEGGRCTERAFLEFHHRVPFADGGASTVENITLFCKAHNGYEAARIFGPLVARERCVPYQLGLDRVRSVAPRSEGKSRVQSRKSRVGSPESEVRSPEFEVESRPKFRRRVA